MLKNKLIGLLLAAAFMLSMTTIAIATDNDDPYSPIRTSQATTVSR